MAVKLRHLKRTVEYEPVKCIAEIAQTAANTGLKLISDYYPSVLIALALCGLSNGSPERKDLIGVYYKSVELFAGKADIHSLVLLQTDIYALSALYKVGALLRYHIRELFSAVLNSKFLLAFKVFKMPSAYFLLLGNSVTYGVYVPE